MGQLRKKPDQAEVEVTLFGENTSSSSGVLEKGCYNVGLEAWTPEATILESGPRIALVSSSA